MGRSCFLPVLLISALLVVSFSHGFGRKVMETFGNEENSTVPSEENGRLSREMVEMDYVDPGPNTNTKSGYLPPPIAAPPES